MADVRTREIDQEWRLRAYVIRVIDGDTFAAELDLGLRVNVGSQRKPIKVRFAGEDTAETGNKSKTEAAKEKAAEATEFVKARLKPGDMVWLVTKSKHVEREDFDDKYCGRVAAEVWYLPLAPVQPPAKAKGKKAPDLTPRWVNLADETIQAGLAKPYDGGTKEAWE